MLKTIWTERITYEKVANKTSGGWSWSGVFGKKKWNEWIGRITGHKILLKLIIKMRNSRRKAALYQIHRTDSERLKMRIVGDDSDGWVNGCKPILRIDNKREAEKEKLDVYIRTFLKLSLIIIITFVKHREIAYTYINILLKTLLYLHYMYIYSHN